MKKLPTLLAFITAKSATVMAYHGTHSAGDSPDFPIYDTPVENILYLGIPLLAYSFALHSLMQFYLRRKYAETTLKNAEEYRGYTAGISAVIVFFLMFTPVFKSLGSVSIPVYGALMVLVILFSIGLMGKENLIEFYSEFKTEGGN